MPFFAPGQSSQDFVPDNLIAGDFPRVTRTVTILSGQNLVRGAVLGKITASSKYILSLSAAGDGSQTPDVILADDVDATAGDKLAGVYLSGEFNEGRLTLGTAHTAATIRDGLRAKAIFLKAAVAA